jgi:beta-catenin-like protein 1
MLLVIKSKRSSRTAAIKCVDYALTRCVPACERFVDALGLKTIFSVFMGKVRSIHWFPYDRVGVVNADP